MTDQVVGITLRADASGFVGEVKRAGGQLDQVRTEAEDADRAVRGAGRAINTAGTLARAAGRRIRDVAAAAREAGRGAREGADGARRARRVIDGLDAIAGRAGPRIRDLAAAGQALDRGARAAADGLDRTVPLLDGAGRAATAAADALAGAGRRARTNAQSFQRLGVEADSVRGEIAGLRTANRATAKALAAQTEASQAAARALRGTANAERAAARDAQVLQQAEARLQASLDAGRISASQHAQAVAELRRAYGRAERGAERAAAGADRLDGRLQHVDATGQTVRDTLQALGGALLVRQIQQYADAWTNAESKLRLATDGAREQAQAQRELFRIAQETRAAFGTTVELYSKMARAGEVLGATQRELLAATRAINQSARISGSSAREARSAIVQLSQALSAGRVQAEEFNSILDQMPALAKAIAREFDRTRGELKNMVDAGAVSSKDLFDAIIAQADRLDETFGGVQTTISAAFTTLSNAVQRYIGTADDSVSATERIAGAITSVARNFDTLANNALAAGTTIGAVLAGRRIGSAREGTGLAGRIARVSGELAGLTARAKAARTASMALDAAMGFFGGPIGATITAVAGGMALLAANTGDAADATRELERETDDLIGRLRAARGETEQAAKARETRSEVQALRTLQDRQERLANLRAQLAAARQEAARAEGGAAFGAQRIAAGAQGRVAELKRAIASLESQTADLRQELGVAADAAIEAGSGVAAAGRDADNASQSFASARERIAALNKEADPSSLQRYARQLANARERLAALKSGGRAALEQTKALQTARQEVSKYVADLKKAAEQNKKLGDGAVTEAILDQAEALAESSDAIDLNAKGVRGLNDAQELLTETLADAIARHGSLQDALNETKDALDDAASATIDYGRSLELAALEAKTLRGQGPIEPGSGNVAREAEATADGARSAADAIRETERATADLADESTRAQDVITGAFEDVGATVKDQLASAFRRGKLELSTFTSLAKRTAADLASSFVVEAGTNAVAGVARRALAGGGSGGGSGGGGGGVMRQAGGLVRSGASKLLSGSGVGSSITSAINNLGAQTGFFASTGGLGGASSASAALTGSGSLSAGATPSVASTQAGATTGVMGTGATAAGTLGAGALGAMGGRLLTGAVGLNQTGGMIGGGLGAGAGFMIAGPVGALIGGLGGSLLGGGIGELIGGGGKEMNLYTGASKYEQPDGAALAESPIGHIGVEESGIPGKDFERGLAEQVAELDRRFWDRFTDAQRTAVQRALRGTRGVRIDIGDEVDKNEIGLAVADRIERMLDAAGAKVPAKIREAAAGENVDIDELEKPIQQALKNVEFINNFFDRAQAIIEGGDIGDNIEQSVRDNLDKQIDQLRSFRETVKDKFRKFKTATEEVEKPVFETRPIDVGGKRGGAGRFRRTGDRGQTRVVDTRTGESVDTVTGPKGRVLRRVQVGTKTVKEGEKVRNPAYDRALEKARAAQRAQLERMLGIREDEREVLSGAAKQQRRYQAMLKEARKENSALARAMEDFGVSTQAATEALRERMAENRRERQLSLEASLLPAGAQRGGSQLFGFLQGAFKGLKEDREREVIDGDLFDRVVSDRIDSAIGDLDDQGLRELRDLVRDFADTLPGASRALDAINAALGETADAAERIQLSTQTISQLQVRNQGLFPEAGLPHRLSATGLMGTDIGDELRDALSDGTDKQELRHLADRVIAVADTAEQAQSAMALLSEEFQKVQQESREAARAERQRREALQSAGGSIAGLIDRMIGGDDSTRSPREKLSRARRSFRADIAQAEDNNLDALQRLTESAPRYLAAQRAVTGAGAPTASTFDSIITQLQNLPATQSFEQRNLDTLGAIEVETGKTAEQAKRTADRLFQELDTDASGGITFSEFKAGLSGQTSDLRAQFDRLDTNHDGIISAQEAAKSELVKVKGETADVEAEAKDTKDAVAFLQQQNAQNLNDIDSATTRSTQELIQVKSAVNTVAFHQNATDQKLGAANAILQDIEANTGNIAGAATGGLVTGAGGPTEDNQVRALSAGEFVVNAGATARHRELLEAVNAGRAPEPAVVAPVTTGQTVTDTATGVAMVREMRRVASEVARGNDMLAEQNRLLKAEVAESRKHRDATEQAAKDARRRDARRRRARPVEMV